MKRFCAILLSLLCITVPASAASWLDTDGLDGLLTPNERALLGGVTPESGDAVTGFRALAQGALSALRGQLRTAVGAGFASLALCVLVSLCGSFAQNAGLSGWERAAELTAVCGLLIISLSSGGGLAKECAEAVRRLDLFSKTLTTAFAAAGAVAGRPVSALSTSAAVLLFSSVLINTAKTVFLPLTQGYILLCGAAAAAESPLLEQGAQFIKWGGTTFFKWFLMLFTGYVSISGLVSGAADRAAVKAAQATISSAVPVVGTIVSGTSEVLLAGAQALRAGIGLFGCLGAVAICLVPFVRAFAHLLVYKLLAAFASSFSGAAVRRLLEHIAGAYELALGLLGTCCAVQFIAIVATLTVAGT